MTNHFPGATKMMETVKAMKRLKVQTNSLACFGCGHEHNCGIHGCRILREAVELIEAQAEEIHRLKLGLDAAIDAVPHGCSTCGKFQGGACEVLFYKDLQPDGCEHWAWRGLEEA